MILAYPSLDDLDVVGETGLANAFADAFAHLLGQHVIAILGSPYDLNSSRRSYGMTFDRTVPCNLRGLNKAKSTESLGLKSIALTSELGQ